MDLSTKKKTHWIVWRSTSHE